MKKTILPALAATCALTFAGPAFAQRGHGPQPHAPKAPTTHVQGGGAATHGGGAATHGGGATAHGGGSHTTVKGPKTTTHGASAHATTTKAKGGPKTTTTTTRTTATTAATTTTTGLQLTPLQQKLQKNGNLADKLQSRLPTNMTVQEASLGFRNLGQFVAAVNVSNNLGIPFAELKAKMLGDVAHLTPDVSDDTPMSLGQAIHALRPTLDADTEATTAQRQADATIAATTTTTTSTKRR